MLVYWAADLQAASTYKDRYEFANRRDGDSGEAFQLVERGQGRLLRDLRAPRAARVHQRRLLQLTGGDAGTEPQPTPGTLAVPRRLLRRRDLRRARVRSARPSAAARSANASRARRDELKINRPNIRFSNSHLTSPDAGVLAKAKGSVAASSLLHHRVGSIRRSHASRFRGAVRTCAVVP